MALTLILMSLLVCGYSTIGQIANLSMMQDLFDVAHWTTAIFSISLGIQIGATTLIVVKTSRVPAWRYVSSHRENLAIVWIIVESGAILTAATATELTLYLLNMNAGAIIAPIISQLSVSLRTLFSLLLADIDPETVLCSHVDHRACKDEGGRREAQVIPLQGYRSYNRNNVKLADTRPNCSEGGVSPTPCTHADRILKSLMTRSEEAPIELRTIASLV